ncbi:MAG: type II toxin-antitoxin system RelE/ParE family toxin [Acidobacteria bacterium]|nr:type II toxin-antitoxin system RelE/ParE family toxin [Acidobacteriota bacterium]
MTDPVTHRSRARLDVLEQFLYLAEEGNVEIAERYLAALEETCALLLEFPNSGTRYDSGHAALQGMRRFPVRGFDNYVIFYLPRLGGIDVVRVLHGNRDVGKIFAEEED